MFVRHTTQNLHKVICVWMQHVQPYTYVAAQVFKITHEILLNLLLMWLPFVSQYLVHHVFEVQTCMFFSAIHWVFKKLVTHEFMNLGASKNTFLVLIVGHSAKRLT
jgi:hypothetical protein